MEGIKKGLRKAPKRQEYLNFLERKRCERERERERGARKINSNAYSLRKLKPRDFVSVYLGGVGAWTQAENCLRS